MASNMDMEKQPLLDAQPSEESQGQELSLQELHQNVIKAQRAYMRAWSKTTSSKWHKRIMLSVTALLVLFMVAGMSFILADGLTEDDWTYPGRVPLEAHIMSKCPDARDCLHDMILPAMQNISHKVDFKLSYIGTVTDHDDGVACQHGQEECLGNVIEVCAQHYYPNPKTYLGFTMCMTKDYEDIPKRELVEDCALEHGISMQRLNDCAFLDDGSLGVNLLQASFNRSAEAGASKSCTVRLNDKIRCIRDGGEWTDCEGGSTAIDLVADILEEDAARWNMD